MTTLTYSPPAPLATRREWHRVQGNELEVARRRYTHGDGRGLWVVGIPAVAPGSTWLSTKHDAQRRAAGRDVIVAVDEPLRKPRSFRDLILAVVEHRLGKMGWYIDARQARSLVGNWFSFPDVVRRRGSVRSLLRFLPAMKAWDFGRDGDSTIASTSLRREPPVAGNMADLRRLASVGWMFVGTVMASPHRARQVDAYLTDLGFKASSEEWDLIIGRWLGLDD